MVCGAGSNSAGSDRLLQVLQQRLPPNKWSMFSAFVKHWRNVALSDNKVLQLPFVLTTSCAYLLWCYRLLISCSPTAPLLHDTLPRLLLLSRLLPLLLPTLLTVSMSGGRSGHCHTRCDFSVQLLFRHRNDPCAPTHHRLERLPCRHLQHA